jgi:hypothetical protein
MAQASPELRALADAACEAINSNDLAGFVALVTEDVEFGSIVAQGKTFRGHEGVRAWWETVLGAFREVSWEPLDVQGTSDRGVALSHMAGKLGNLRVEERMWQAVRLRDGKVSWWGFFHTEHEALEAVGLSE